MTRVKINNVGLNIAENNVSIEPANDDVGLNILSADFSLHVQQSFTVFGMSDYIEMWGESMFGGPGILGTSANVRTHKQLNVIRTD